jgi:hypothetical protein
MISFKQFLTEGNPLARMYKHASDGRHFIAMSAARPGQSASETKAKMKELEHHFTSHGYGVRKTEGHWEGGKESSIVVHAKSPGNKAGAELMAHARKAGIHHDQDSILHHNGKTARLVGTNDSGYPGKGKTVKVGDRLKMNNPHSEFQTEFHKTVSPERQKIHLSKGRISKGPARFTT